MNTRHLEENLLGYLLDGLDQGEKSQVESLLQTDDEARLRLEQLRLALEPLNADRDVAASEGLIARTIGRVAEHCCQELPRAPVLPMRPPERSWWRRSDVLVAASLLLVVMGIGLPAVLKMRSAHATAAIAECKNNLMIYHKGLETYRDKHGQFPNVSADGPHKAAGIVVPVLLAGGMLPAGSSVRCPGNGGKAECSVTLEEASGLTPEQFEKKAGKLLPCYAYSLGFVDDGGNYHGPRACQSQLESQLPLMADCPGKTGAGKTASTVSSTNSGNHGGHGQNVLFADGHVRFANITTLGHNGDDIYRNRAGKIAAGLDCLDTVLGPSASRP